MQESQEVKSILQIPTYHILKCMSHMLHISQIPQCIATAQTPLFDRSIRISTHAQLPPTSLCHSLLLISLIECEFCDVETPSVFCSLWYYLYLHSYLGSNRHSINTSRRKANRGHRPLPTLHTISNMLEKLLHRNKM